MSPTADRSSITDTIETTVADLLAALQDVCDDDDLVIAAASRILNQPFEMVIEIEPSQAA